jgi:6-phosphogluconolactonase
MKEEHAIRVFQTPKEMAEKFASEIIELIRTTGSVRHFSVALAGGSTPELLYSILGEKFADSISWNRVNFFWGDERCVPPQSDESNYGMTFRTFLSKIKILECNIHRIIGEADPADEAVRYSAEIESEVIKFNGLPQFDLILLGLGDDGHTASIFPDQIKLTESQKTCAVAVHPQSGQKRITLTGRVINNASMIAFLVTGKKKAEIVRKILNEESGAENYPASRVVSHTGQLIWLLDKEAASGLLHRLII